jgi:hypothetical protein
MQTDQIGQFRKKPSCGVALQLRRCGAPVSAPHPSVFARLASGAFHETLVLVPFYEITKFIQVFACFVFSLYKKYNTDAPYSQRISPPPDPVFI